MSIKTILVPLDGTEVSGKKLPTAHAAARQLGAHLDVLYLNRDAKASLPFVFGSIAAKGLRETVISAAAQSLQQQRDQDRRSFDSFCERHQIPLIDQPPGPAGEDQVSASWREAEVETLVENCRFSDLVTVIRTPSDAQPWLLEATLLKAARPVLLVPPAAPSSLGHNIAVGWNNSVESARAVGAALPFLTRADHVSVFSAAKREDSARRLITYLRWHGVHAELRRFEPGQRPVGEALLAEAAVINADLFVAGAYSRTRASELLFGGVTRHFINHAGLPLLLAH